MRKKPTFDLGPLRRVKRAISLFAVLAVIALALNANAVVTASGSAQGQGAHAFSGEAFIDDKPAPQGAVVAAVWQGVNMGMALVDATGKYSGLRVPTAGITVAFTVNGLPAAETATTEAGGATILNLRASSGTNQSNGAPGSTPAPTPASTSVPRPAPTPTNPPPPPTPGPTAESVHAAFRIGPTVRLRPVNDVIGQHQDGIVEVLFRNPVLNERVMIVDMTVAMPSGFHLYGEGFATDSAAGAASGTYSVPPGQSRTIYINVKSEKAGRFTVQFSGTYWPKGSKDLFNPLSLTHLFIVNEPSPSPFSAAPTNPSQVPGAVPAATAVPASRNGNDGCGVSPGGNGTGNMVLLGVPLIGLVGMAGLRRRRREL